MPSTCQSCLINWRCCSTTQKPWQTKQVRTWSTTVRRRMKFHPAQTRETEKQSDNSHIIRLYSVYIYNFNFQLGLICQIIVLGVLTLVLIQLSTQKLQTVLLNVIQLVIEIWWASVEIQKNILNWRRDHGHGSFDRSYRYSCNWVCSNLHRLIIQTDFDFHRGWRARDEHGARAVESLRRQEVLLRLVPRPIRQCIRHKFDGDGIALFTCPHSMSLCKLKILQNVTFNCWFISRQVQNPSQEFTKQWQPNKSS